MHTIEEITIKEFRGIKTTKEPIRLSKFNVLIGKNNSGKSSILESLSLFPLPFKAYSIPLLGKSKFDLISGLHSSSSALIYGYSGRSEITFRVRNDKITYVLEHSSNIKTKINYAEISEREYIEKIINILEIDSKRDAIERLMTYSIFMPNDTNFIKIIGDNIKINGILL